MTNLLFYLSFALTTNWTAWDNGNKQDYTLPLVYPYTAPKDRADAGYTIGEVRSNLTANVVYDGKTNSFVQSSLLLGFIHREWTEERKQVWSEPKWTPARNQREQVLTVGGKPEIVEVWDWVNVPPQYLYVTNTCYTNWAAAVTNKPAGEK